MLRICSYNIHKGFSQFNRRMVVHELRERLRSLDADLVFLQEVQGLHLGHPARHPDWPLLPQHEFLAEDAWQQTAYGGNAVYDHGHHGNAILSRHLILSTVNQDVSDHRFERRGLLHCEVQLPAFERPVHCVCVHLGLMAGSRRRQMMALAERMEQLAPGDTPLIIAGDFNDWKQQGNAALRQRDDLHEVFERHHGQVAKSYPARWPLLRLDRIYLRNARSHNPEILGNKPWSHLSDHLPLAVEVHL